VAELIHKNSARGAKLFVCINCAAIPDSLLESELFGYEKGAFTGAHGSREGKLAVGNGGTILLDEIGDMTPYAQAKILRAIEGKQIYRLGGHQPIVLNVRILAATNRDLDAWATEDTFRSDLYFRLNVARVHLPPLRERKSDIPLLVRFYVRELNERFGSSVESIGEDLMGPLMEYHWPGNIRELRNLLESVFVSRPARRIAFLDLPEWFRKRVHAQVVSPPNEPEMLLSVLRATQWNKSKAASSLKWSRMTLYRKMAKYNLPKDMEDVKL
jgi:transcriptional regulator with PAS, ATPase and Fis domain